MALASGVLLGPYEIIAPVGAGVMGEVYNTRPTVTNPKRCHNHADHGAGNRVFEDAGAVVLAQRNVRGWIHAENLKFLTKDAKPEPRTVNLHLGSRELHVRSFPGRTGGDSVVLIPDAKVAFGGDLFWRNTLPNRVDASTNPWIDTLDTLAKNHTGHTFIPGHGDPGTAQDVAAFREYLATLQKLVTDAQAQGKSGDALTGAVMPSLTEKYGQWDFFTYLATLNILEAEAELSGKKRIPRAQPQKCLTRPHFC